MIEFDFQEAINQIFAEVNGHFLDAFQNQDSEKIQVLEEKSNELTEILKARSKKSFEFIVRSNDINLFREYVNENNPEQIYLEDQPKGNLFIFRLISLFIQLSKELPEKAKISQCLRHYLLQINKITNLNFRTQLKFLLKQIYEVFSNETDQNSQDLIQTTNDLMEKLSIKMET